MLFRLKIHYDDAMVYAVGWVGVNVALAESVEHLIKMKHGSAPLYVHETAKCKFM